jgi:lipopolysaccharide/colanic/teichoic acid biosynthesis glycosyltransferase
MIPKEKNKMLTIEQKRMPTIIPEMSASYHECSIGTNRLIPKKRNFEVLLVISTSWIWIPLTLATALVLWTANGSPILYLSKRRICRSEYAFIPKFRTMIPNADQILNRDTVPVEQSRFLNIPINSPVYTKIGRWVERLMFTELPQLFLVLSGKMHLVGNRPLPENVIKVLKEAYPETEHRFDLRCGMTGPVQLIGRERLTDKERLQLEIEYCKMCIRNDTFRLDCLILFMTVLVGFRLMRPLSIERVYRMMHLAVDPKNWTMC